MAFAPTFSPSLRSLALSVTFIESNKALHFSFTRNSSLRRLSCSAGSSSDATRACHSSQGDAELQDAASKALALVLSENGLSKEDALLISSQAYTSVRSIIEAALELDELAAWTSNLGLVEKEREFALRAYDVAKSNKGRQIASLLESFGVEQRNLSRVSQVLASQNLSDLLEKINFFRESCSHERDESITMRSRKMMQESSISVDDGLQKTLSFFEKMEARRNGLKVLSTPESALPRLFEEFPQVLAKSLEDEIKPLFGYLESIGVPEEKVMSVVMCYPSVLLIASVEDLQKRLRMLKRVDVKSRYFGEMIVKFPWILSSSIQHNAESVAGFLGTLIEHKGVIRCLIIKCPNLLGCSVSSLEKMVRHIESLGVPRNRLGHAIARSPQLLLKRQNAFDEVCEYLQALGVGQKDLRIIFLKSPQLFASTTPFLQRKIAFLHQIGIPQYQLKTVVTKYPMVLMMSIEGLKPRLEYLKSMGLSKRDISFMICCFPPLIGYSVENVLRPKFEFLEDVIGHPVREVVMYPRYFSYCLKKKLRPRIRVLKRLGLELDLKSMLSKNDEEFAAEHLGVGRMLVPPP